MKQVKCSQISELHLLTCYQSHRLFPKGRFSPGTRFKAASHFQSVRDARHLPDLTPQKMKSETSPLLLPVVCWFGTCNELVTLRGTTEQRQRRERGS